MIDCKEDRIRHRWSRNALDDKADRGSLALEMDVSVHRADARRAFTTTSGHVTKLDDRQMRSASNATELEDESPLHASLPSLRGWIAPHAHGPKWISRPPSGDRRRETCPLRRS